MEKTAVKQIPNFKDYKITDTGQVINRSGKILKQNLSGNYPAIALCKNGKPHTKRIHRLVLEAFIGPCPQKMECNHIDGNKHNNNLSNLEWTTCSKNHKHAYRLGLRKQPNHQGEKHPNAKLKDGEVWLIKQILKANIVTQKHLGKMFKVNFRTISRIKTKDGWTHI